MAHQFEVSVQGQRGPAFPTPVLAQRYAEMRVVFEAALHARDGQPVQIGRVQWHSPSHDRRQAQMQAGDRVFDLSVRMVRIPTPPRPQTLWSLAEELGDEYALVA